MTAGVYGLGRFGTFWAECLRDAGLSVKAYSRSEHPVPEGVERAGEDEVLSSDLLFFTVAISAFESVLGNAFARAEKRVFAVRAGGEKKLAILPFAFLESGGKLTDAERFF